MIGSAYSENGSAYTASTGGPYALGHGAFLVSKNAIGLHLTGANTSFQVTIDGTVRGDGGGAGVFQSLSTSPLFLLVGETGSIHSGSWAITSNSSVTLMNKGIVSANAQNALLVNNSLSVTNQGIISSLADDAILVYGNLPHTINNSGRIYASAGFGAVVSLDKSVDTVTNTGTIRGDIKLGDGSDLYSGASGRIAGAVFGEAGNDKITGGIDNDRFEGGDGDDWLIGNKGRDTLKGDAGNDKLEGGLGRDLLWGGAGRDAFVFKSPATAANADTIYDFNRRDDTIQVDNAVFKKIGANGTLKAAAFKLGKVASDADDRIIYDRATGKVFYDADGDGAQKQVHLATLANKVAINHLDFQVI
ncbi:MAG: calcium-binding protein [Rhizobiaceae bacterium]|nr:calcium-binding protein [Rhizobiaceae bacterium]